MASPLRGQLPGYAFDLRMKGGGRYRHVLPDGRLGNLVSRDSIVTELRSIHDLSAVRFGNLAADTVSGRISAADFEAVMRAELRDLYNGTSALARGGWSQMDAAAWGRNGQILRGEYDYLAGFVQDIADGKLTEAQAIARAQLYAGKAYSRYWAEDQLLKIAGGHTEERWMDTGDAVECQTCLNRAKLGWVPIGSIGAVPGDGSSECLGHDRCELLTR